MSLQRAELVVARPVEHVDLRVSHAIHPDFSKHYQGGIISMWVEMDKDDPFYELSVDELYAYTGALSNFMLRRTVYADFIARSGIVSDHVYDPLLNRWTEYRSNAA
ncbi:hypothetical protein A3B02_02230 [Candidatus Roizmanbacteria bacterium RIFCSPLOWO2_01_FULL_42_14]|uniref:Uncharacterized protein n=3 Tax=Candidatus Roizmaniibacteriota TaxID=1752723 RepID=A0A1F7JXF1_9BACT|nr:MAG: hypothetical protein A3D08_01145 [Candidatus Roizmanbacteria bacterium RIFCSPHIGHO2_02_FULL_43_11]OGK51941.1 MAG: hypothetical protein A3B02_02230 [Candidatus Roizmanbacteria bacterium RIFCSPLOWO2_01_FULL_42_14]OGK60290.1 MAG: hypothetical protein A3I56_04325 [Candidatus Roizmanbacteria bacterium RIFCSPLOWO2_02_FULL_43_10]